MKLQTATLDEDEQAIIKIRKIPKYMIPAYDRFGGNMDFATKVSGFPKLYDTIQMMSKQTAWFWWELVKLRDRKTNQAFYKPVDKVTINRVSGAYKRLKVLGLIKRIKRQHYIINPRALIPAENSQFDEVLGEWEKTK